MTDFGCDVDEAAVGCCDLRIGVQFAAVSLIGFVTSGDVEKECGGMKLHHCLHRYLVLVHVAERIRGLGKQIG